MTLCLTLVLYKLSKTQPYGTGSLSPEGPGNTAEGITACPTHGSPNKFGFLFSKYSFQMFKLFFMYMYMSVYELMSLQRPEVDMRSCGTGIMVVNHVVGVRN